MKPFSLSAKSILSFLLALSWAACTLLSQASPPEPPELPEALTKEDLPDLGGNLGLPALDEDLLAGASADLPQVSITWGLCEPTVDPENYSLSWTYVLAQGSSQATLTDFLIQRRDGPGPWETKATVPPIWSSTVDFNLLANQRYHYRIVPQFSITNRLVEGTPSEIHIYHPGTSLILSKKERTGYAPLKECPPGFEPHVSDPNKPRRFRTYKTTESFNLKHYQNEKLFDDTDLVTLVRDYINTVEKSGNRSRTKTGGEGDAPSKYSGTASFSFSNDKDWTFTPVSGLSSTSWEDESASGTSVVKADGSWAPWTGEYFREGGGSDRDYWSVGPSSVEAWSFGNLGELQRGTPVITTTATRKVTRYQWSSTTPSQAGDNLRNLDIDSGYYEKVEELSDEINLGGTIDGGNGKSGGSGMTMGPWSDWTQGYTSACATTEFEQSTCYYYMRSKSEVAYKWQFSPRAVANATVRWAMIFTPTPRVNEPADSPAIDYRRWKAQKKDSESREGLLSCPEAGTVCLSPYTVSLTVFDQRGGALPSQADAEEMGQKEFFNYGTNSDPDPNGAYILVSDSAGSPATLRSAEIELFTGGAQVDANWESKLTWNGSELTLSESGPNGEVQLQSPLTCKGPVSRRFTIRSKIIPQWTTRSTISLQVNDGNGRSAGDEKVYLHILRQLPEGPPISWDERIPLSDAVGPRYRKIGLNGRPLSDSKPQLEAETDEAKEETYVDAFNLNLRHSVTDIYLPIPGSELALSARRNAQSEIWNLRSGLRPHERLDLPFGPAWGTNLVSYIEFVDYSSASLEQPNEAFVHDETGSVHHFVKYTSSGVDRWVPFATGKHEGRAFLTDLKAVGSEWVFTQKYGNTLYFPKGSGQAGQIVYGSVAQNRLDGSSETVTYAYARLDRVVDRLGYQLVYRYRDQDDPSHSTPTTLIPYTVFAKRPDDQIFDGLQLFIKQDAQKRITQIWDPMGNVVSYEFQHKEDLRHPVTAQIQPLDFMTSVEVHDPANTLLRQTEYRYNNRNAVDIEPETLPRPPTTRPAPFLHVDLTHIISHTSDIQALDTTATWQFTYQFDHTKMLFVDAEYAKGYFPQDGLPRGVSSIQPSTDVEPVQFENLSSIQVGTEGVGNDLKGTRQTRVTDSLGNVVTYTFLDNEILVLTKFSDFYYPGGNPPEKFYNPRLVYFKKMEISYGSVGKETFTFNPAAGLALESLTDLSGNLTTFAYGETLSAPAWLADIYPDDSLLYKRWDDVTSQTNALGNTRSFTYSNRFRMMESITDEEGRYTKYEIDPEGRRIGERVFVHKPGTGENENTLCVKETATTYHSLFPGFVTQERVKRLAASDPDWATDLITTFTPDALGRVASQSVNAGQDANAQDQDPLVTQYTYDRNGNRTSVTDPLGKITVFTYDGFNRLTQTTYHNWDFEGRSYDLRGNLTQQRVGSYNAPGFTSPQTVLRLSDFRYDAANRRIETESLASTPSGGAPVTYVVKHGYNAVGSLSQVIDAREGSTEYTYDTLQRLVRLKNADGKVTTYEYDPAKNPGASGFDSSSFKPTKTTDPRGFVTECDYDKLYRLKATRAEWKKGAFAATTSQYDGVGNLTDVTDPLGKVTHTEYDALNRPISVTAAYGASYATVTTTAYTNTGLAWKTTLAGAEGTLWPAGDKTLKVTETRYDLAGRAIQVTHPEARVGDGRAVEKTFYDKAGNIIRTVDPRTSTLVLIDSLYGYDDRHRQIQAQLPDVLDALSSSTETVRPTTHTSYNPDGTVATRTDPKGIHTVFSYDRLGRCTEQTIYNRAPGPGDSGANVPTLLLTTSSKYDPNGNVLEVLDPENKKTVNTYDALNRLLTTTNAEGITTECTYDASGNRIAVTDGKKQKTRFEYDGLGRLTAEIDPANKAKRFFYDAVNKTREIDSLGQITDYQYDDHHRLSHVLHVGVIAEDLDYAYDAAGNLVDAVYPHQDGTTNTHYTYDARNQRRSETSGGITNVVHTYGYDLAGNRTSLSTSGDSVFVINYEFDKAGRLSKVIQEAADNDQTTEYRYDLNGNVHREILPNGEQTVTTHDALNRIVTRQGYTPANALAYTFTYVNDRAGNVTEIKENYADNRLPGRVIDNVYDDAYRLEKETIASASVGTGAPPTDASPPAKKVVTTYGYDPANNRTARSVATTEASTETTETAVYSYNALNQLTKTSTPTHVVSFDYDLNGNRVRRSSLVRWTTTPTPPAVTTYRYDRNNRLVAVIEGGSERLVEISAEGHIGTDITASYYIGGVSHRYRYDHRTRRVERTEPASGGGSATTRVTFAGGVSVAEYPAGSTTPDVRYVRGADIGGGVGGMLYSLRPGTASYSHYNARGDVVARTDDTGAATYSAAYEAFGTVTAKSPETANANLDRFAANSKEQDPTGLLNEGFRYRDLETGVFLTRDPLGFVDGPNMYTYVVQNPWSKFDPEGLNAWDTVKGWGRTAVNFGGGFAVGAIEGTFGVNHPAESYGAEYSGRDFGRKAALAVGITLTAKGGTDMGVGTAKVGVGLATTGASGGTLAIAGLPLAAQGAAQGALGAAETAIGGAIVLNSQRLDAIPGGPTARDVSEKKVPNPNGSKGSPDHQAANDKLVEKFKEKYPASEGFEVRSNQSIKNETGINRRPDAAAVKDGKVVEVGEVARTQSDGTTLVKREQVKQAQYQEAGIESTVEKLPPKK